MAGAGPRRYPGEGVVAGGAAAAGLRAEPPASWQLPGVSSGAVEAGAEGLATGAGAAGGARKRCVRSQRRSRAGMHLAAVAAAAAAAASRRPPQLCPRAL